MLACRSMCFYIGAKNKLKRLKTVTMQWIDKVYRCYSDIVKTTVVELHPIACGICLLLTG